MENWTADIVAFVSQHGAWAGPVVGLALFGESLAFVGLFIPATALMLAIGGLMGAGALPLASTAIWAIAGATLGSWASYLIGRCMGPAAYRRWPLKAHRPQMAQARLFFRRHGFLTIFFSRFLGPARSTIPLVAGVLRMTQGRFQIANLISTAIWAPVMLAPGYLAAQGLDLLGGLTVPHLIGLGAAAILLCSGILLARRRFRNGAWGERRSKQIA